MANTPDGPKWTAWSVEVQDFLNCSHEERVVLLSDLAKAFERVNPHWIIHVLMCRGSLLLGA